jgi:hypothetical protein
LDRQDQGRTSVGQTGPGEDQRWTDRTRGGSALGRQDQGRIMLERQDQGRISVGQAGSREDQRWTDRTWGRSAPDRKDQVRIRQAKAKAKGRISIGQDHKGTSKG